MIKKCVVCGAEFYAPPSSKKITCSKSCSGKRRSRLLKNHAVSAEAKAKISRSALKRGFTDNLKKGTLSAQASVKAGKTDQNSSAKFYVLRSPDGRIFEASNLSNFIRRNPDLFEIERGNEKEVEKVAHGFYTVKKNIKADKGCQTYHDWTVLDWDDRKNFEKLKK